MRSLRDFYYNLNNSGAYSGPANLHLILKKKGKKFTFGQIKQFLSNEDSHSLQKPLRHNFRRPRVIVTHIAEEYEADLMVVQNLSKSNDKIQYLLIVIDIFSRFLWVQPLINKTAAVVIY